MEGIIESKRLFSLCQVLELVSFLLHLRPYGCVTAWAHDNNGGPCFPVWRPRRE